MISGQFQIRDILNYILPGSLILGISCLVVYNFTGLNVLDLITDKLVLSLLIIAVTYIIGFFMRAGFSNYAKIKGQKTESRIGRFLLKIFIGKSKHKDEKVSKYKEWEAIIVRKFVNRGILSMEEISKQSINDLFYIAFRYIENYGSPTSLFQIERLHISFNLAFKLCTAFILSQIVSIIMLIFRIFGIGELNLSIILTMLIVSIFSLRYSWKVFESSIDAQAINVWRTFLIVEKKE